MIDIKKIRNDFANVQKNLFSRDKSLDISQIAKIDSEILETSQKIDNLKSQRNQNSAAISKGKLEAEEKLKKIEETKSINQEIKKLEGNISSKEEAFKTSLMGIPNLLQDQVPEGADESANIIVKKFGELPKFNFTPKSHDELTEKSGMMDFQRGVKLAHSRFTLLRGHVARLERALISFMLDIQTKEHGYEEVAPPILVNQDTITYTGQLPKFEEDLFKTTTGLYLIPTAEVPLTSIYANEILPEESLPLQFTAFTPCFRSEAGSYGKDTKGYLRQHQFNKVELVWITHPEHSEEAHQKMLKHAERILELLEIPYQTLMLSSGDTGFCASKCYDIEAWIPSQDKYREISSCSNCTDFQTRRAQIRIRPKNGGKPILAHSLNGSGLAAGRTLIAVLENYQQEDGSIEIPKVLSPYMGGLTKI